MAGIEFGVFDHIEHLPGVPLQTLHGRRLDQIEALDQAGFYIYQLAEHHTPAVHSMAPSQSVFLAAAAQRTKNIRLCPCVYVLPIHHPLRLMEEICMVDSLSGGRFDIGVGPGTRLEAYFWGQEGDEESNRARFEETLAILQLGLANDELTYEGRFYNFDRVPMRLRPTQQPYPPFWYMRNFETAAQHRMNCMVVGNLDGAEGNIRKYRKLWAAYHGQPLLTPQGREPLVGAAAFLVLADTDEEAQAIAGPAMESFRWNLMVPRRLEAERRGLTDRFYEPGVNPNAPTARERHYASDEIQELEVKLAELSPAELAERKRRRTAGRVGPGGGIAGSPETIRTYMEEYMTTGANYMMLAFQFGNLTHEQAMRSIELFATEVMPRFKRRPQAALVS